ncbi:zinc finger protein 32-like [Topomyia yanbarensis]|uniref:zinc finger protein 32-like n=1 Tax=Topomyia yanbarensis TaxID=2498891 RepID=UPI00273C0172|nr:zinc finger protein 32-like [Topomyia yanbarensis]
MDASKHELPYTGTISFCRLCLKTNSIELIVQSPEEANEPLLNIISECLGIWLTVTEDFPFGVCHDCCMSLEAIRQFRYNCQQCDLYLKSQRSSSDPGPGQAVDLDSSTEQKPIVEDHRYPGLQPNVMVLQDVKLEEPSGNVGGFNGSDVNQVPAQYYESPAQESMAAVPVAPSVPLKKFDCPECGKQLYSSRMLSQHVVREHRLCHSCRSCGMAYNSPDKLEMHVATCTGRPSRFMCNQCPSGKVFSTAISLSVHLYYAHDSLQSVVYRCESCKKNFKNRTGLKYHYKTGHGCTMVECEICRRPFPTEESLYYHKLVEH